MNKNTFFILFFLLLSFHPSFTLEQRWRWRRRRRRRWPKCYIKFVFDFRFEESRAKKKQREKIVGKHCAITWKHTVIAVWPKIKFVNNGSYNRFVIPLLFLPIIALIHWVEWQTRDLWIVLLLQFPAASTHTKIK